MDLYKQVAEEFSVARNDVKMICMPLMYTSVPSPEQSLLYLMRSQVKMALALGMIKTVSKVGK